MSRGLLTCNSENSPSEAIRQSTAPLLRSFRSNHASNQEECKLSLNKGKPCPAPDS